jgi:FkbM family methyltransferase
VIRFLVHAFAGLFGRPGKSIVVARQEDQNERPSDLVIKAADEVASKADPVVPYDENLLERARTQWQFGEWQSLAQLNRDTLQHHPDRAKLALLAAAGRLQTGQEAEARQLIRLAQDWGISKKLISQILIAGVHNSIGRAAAIGNQQHHALQHFESAIHIGTPGADAKLLTQARTAHQLHQLGLISADGSNRIQVLEKPQTVLENRNSPTKPEVAPAEEKQKFSSDADIDDFIEDIAPFFRNQSIVYVDVGAYIGEVFTKLLDSKTIIIREAHLIEPNPKSYHTLQDAVKARTLQSCNTYHIGISNTPGTARFKAAESMTKRVRANIAGEHLTNLFETECRKLDEIAEHFTDRHAHLIKLDVEGEELDVLSSAERLLREQRVDVLYVEVGFNRHGTQQTYFGDLDAMLQSYGYRVFKIYEQMNEWIDDSPLLRRCNAAYMSSRFASAKTYSFTIKQ